MASLPEKEGWELVEATRQLLREAQRGKYWNDRGLLVGELAEPVQRRVLLAMADAEDALDAAA